MGVRRRGKEGPDSQRGIAIQCWLKQRFRSWKSTKRGAMLVFDTCVRVWSSTQTVFARSSCEAESRRGTVSASGGRCLLSMCEDLGMELVAGGALG